MANDCVGNLDDAGGHSISTVTLTELRLGVHKQFDPGTATHREAVTKLDRLLARFDLLEDDRSVAVAAAEIIADLQQAGEPLHDLHDVYIAAAAITEKLPVLTGNVDDFDRIDGLEVVD